MKDEELDRLFKQNSELFRAEPSPQAWQQLEQGLQQKKEKKVWFYLSGIAASLLLFVGLWLSVDYSNQLITHESAGLQQENKQTEAARFESVETLKEEKQEQAQGVANIHNEQNKVKINQVPKKKAAPAKSPKSNVPGAAATYKKIIKEETAVPLAFETELPKLENKAAHPIDVPEQKLQPHKALAQVSDESEEIIIRYSSEGDEGSDLAASPGDLASIQEEKGLSARTVVGFLKKVKENSSDGLSDIREVKDQIFSIRMGR